MLNDDQSQGQLAVCGSTPPPTTKKNTVVQSQLQLAEP